MMIRSPNIVIYVLINDVTNALILDVTERECVCVLDAHPACSLIKSKRADPVASACDPGRLDDWCHASLGVAEVVGGVVEGVAVLVEGVAAGQPVPAQGGGVRAGAGAGARAGGGAGSSFDLHHAPVFLAGLPAHTGNKQNSYNTHTHTYIYIYIYIYI